MMNFSKNKLIMIFLCTLICVLSIIQSFRTLNDYARLWHRAFWRMRSETSFSRSAVFHLKPRGAEFLQFIESIVPPNAHLVVVPGEYRGFSHQNIVLFFLIDRVIITCGKSNEEIRECVQEPDSFILSIENFPPKDAITNKKFIQYGSGDNEYKGIYVPSNYTPYSPDEESFYNPILTMLLDFLILSALFFAGSLACYIFLKKPDTLSILMLGIPLGLGIYTWVLFGWSWAGGRLSTNSVIFLFLTIVILLLLIFRRISGSYKFIDVLKQKSCGLILQLRSFSIIETSVLFIICTLLLVAVIISIGKGYSLYDDMAIWSLKGYYIAQKGTIFAAEKASGHGLAYPLNISLGVTTFSLISGDLLPGSKFLFPLLTGALLLGCYWFLKRQEVPRLLAILGVFFLISVPVIFQYTTYGFANMPFTAYLVLGILWSIDGFTKKNFRFVIMGGVLLTFAGWTRPEGIGFAYILALSFSPFFLLWKPKLNQVFIWLLCIGSLSGIWLAFGYQYMADDQIGGALGTFIDVWKTNGWKMVSIQQFINQASYSFSKPEIWGWIIPISMGIIIFSLPKILLKKDFTGLSLMVVTITATLVPFFMFFIESFSESNFPLFLSVSFDRAYFPAVFLLTLTAINTIKHWLPDTIKAEQQLHP